MDIFCIGRQVRLLFLFHLSFYGAIVSQFVEEEVCESWSGACQLFGKLLLMFVKPRSNSICHIESVQ